MTPIQYIRAWLIKLRHEEPVAAIGTVATLFIGTGEWVQQIQPQFASAANWKQAGLVVLAYLIPAVSTKLMRANVYAPATVQDLAETAHSEGRLSAFQEVATKRKLAAVKGVQTRVQKQTEAAAPEADTDTDNSVEVPPKAARKPRVVKRPQTKKK